MKRALLVTYDPPPIPGWQQFAYRALLDGYDEGDPIGYGPTPLAAVRDLAWMRRMDVECDLAHSGGAWDSADLRARLRESRGIDNAIREAREDARRVAPFWMFGERTPVQLLIRHPAHHAPTVKGAT